MSATAPGALQQTLTANTHHFGTLWKISLADQITFFRFTDHDVTLKFEEFANVFMDYSPVAGFSPSATQFHMGLAEHNKEFRGPVDARDSSDTIVGPTYDQLRAGAFREAQVEEWLVDWRVAWIGAFQLQKFWITDAEFDNEEFRFNVEGLVRWLRPRIGDVYARNCRWDLGRNRFGNISATSGCRYDVDGDTELATVTTVNTQRRQVTVSGLSNQGDDHWTFGRVNWVTGNNENQIGQVSQWVETSNVMRFQQNTPFDIQVGDIFEVEPGCDKLTQTCINKFNNLINYGGQVYIPGNDLLLKVPRG